MMTGLERVLRGGRKGGGRLLAEHSRLTLPGKFMDFTVYTLRFRERGESENE